jgi:hypothetical protein
MKIKINSVSTLPINIPPDYTYKMDYIPFFIGPNSIEISEPIEITGTRIILDNILAGHPPPPVLILGRTEYEDVFGYSHWLEWCYRLRYEAHREQRLRAHFVQWGEYNRSDEDT